MQEVVDALVAGAAAAGQSAAGAATKAAVTDAYTGLKALLSRRFAERASARVALAEVEAQAASGGDEQVAASWRTVLEDELRRIGADDADDELQAAAQRVLALVVSKGSPSRAVETSAYRVDARHSQGTVVGGHHHTVSQTFGTARADGR